MLSTKRRKKTSNFNEPFAPISAYDTLIEQEYIVSALGDMMLPAAPKLVGTETQNYEPIAVFLNHCIKNVDKVYENARSGPPSSKKDKNNL
ncbi:hypothetical protein C0991_002715, partial [Blastosporella zonata]